MKSASNGRTADLSRRHRVSVGPAGVVAITGGKLTTYREMAADTVDELLGRLADGRRGRARCRTKRLKLLGADGYTEPPAGSPAAHLGGRYGTLATEVEALVTADASLGEPLIPGLPYLRAEAVYAVRHEMATTLDDVLLRRTRAHLFDRPLAVEYAPFVAELIAGELGWDGDTVVRQVAAYRDLVAAEEADARATPAAT